MIKNLNISLKYTRNTGKLLESFLTPKGNCADGLGRLKITLLGKCEGRHTAKMMPITLFGAMGETLHFRWYKKTLL